MNYLTGLQRFVLATLTLSLISCGGDVSGTGDGGDENQSGYHGQAILGPIINATIEVRKLFGDQAVLCSVLTTDSRDLAVAGTFTIPENCIDDPEMLYVVSFSDGQDIDADDDGVLDEVFTTVNGTYHAILDFEQFKLRDWKVSAATDAAYQAVVMGINTLQIDISEIKQILDEHSNEFLKEDINGDAELNYDDTLQWHPVKNRDAVLDINAVYAVGIEYLNNHSTSMVENVMLDDVLVGHVNTENPARLVSVLGTQALIVRSDGELMVVDEGSEGFYVVQRLPLEQTAVGMVRKVTKIISLPEQNGWVLISSIMDWTARVITHWELTFVSSQDGVARITGKLSMPHDYAITDILVFQGALYAYASSGVAIDFYREGPASRERPASALFKINISNPDNPFIEHARDDISLISLGVYQDTLWGLEIDLDASFFPEFGYEHLLNPKESYWISQIDPDSLYSSWVEQPGDFFDDGRDYLIGDASQMESTFYVNVFDLTEDDSNICYFAVSPEDYVTGEYDKYPLLGVVKDLLASGDLVVNGDLDASDADYLVIESRCGAWSVSKTQMFSIDIMDGESVRHPVKLGDSIDASDLYRTNLHEMGAYEQETRHYYLGWTDTYQKTGYHRYILRVWDKQTLQLVLEKDIPTLHGYQKGVDIFEYGDKLYLAAGYYGLLIVQLPVQ